MFKKTIQYEDFNGNTREKDFYFHLSKAELLELAADGDSMMERIKRIIAAKDGKAIINEFRQLIKMSVGMRSEDGERFIKDREAQSHLLDSPAFDSLLMELCTQTNASVEFVTQLIPEKMRKEMQKAVEAQKDKRPDGTIPDPFKEAEDDRPAYQRENRHPTNAEMLSMSKQELAAAFAWREQNNL